MCEANTARELILRATDGDRVAMERLLLEHYARLSRHIAGKLAGPLGRLVSVDDVLQETFVLAIRDIRQCEADSEQSFCAWLMTIADHRVQDIRRGLRRKRRGGGRRQVRGAAAQSASTMADLVELIADPADTPSRPIARREAVQAIQVGLAGLPAHQREVIRLRYLGGQSIDETAAAGRTPAAVRGLIHRAKKALREVLGHSSLWFSRK